jgi:hypothetical protein
VVTLAVSTALTVSGCRSAALAYGPDAASARTNFDALASAIEYRFTNVARTPKFANARMRVARYAFAPSKLVNDTVLWTGLRSTRTGAARDLEIHAGLVANQYLFTARTGVPLPTRVGDERHLITLEQRGESDWFWHTEVDHAVGALPPSRVTDVFHALFASAERAPGAVRADYRGAFPRTTQALGRMITIDSVGTATQGDGSTLVTLRMRLDGGKLARTFPAFGKYVQKYLEPTRWHYRLADHGGADWFDAEGGNTLVTLRFRSHDGQLQPLRGGARAMPDSLTLYVDALAKLGLFTVGVTKMQGEFVHVSTARERAWAMRFTKEPEWHLPLIAERLLRSPLRRPFEGRGMVFRLGFRTAPDGQTLLARTFDVTVRESAIMRFLGNLGFTAMSDYAGKVEEEENRFIAEAMQALKADMAALKQ